jgi:hypothetical protein
MSYQANTEHPLYEDLRDLVLKTSGLVGILEEALDRKDVRIAFVFGRIFAETSSDG